MGDEADKVTGGCLCGTVRYEAEVYLKTAHYCHCRMCQRSSGAPAEIGVTVKPGSLAFTKDEPTYYQSSPFARRGFCRLCGSSLVWEAPSRPEWTSLSVGSLDQPEEVVPSQHIHVDSQLPWYQLDDGLPRSRSDEDPELTAAWLTTRD